MSTFLACGARDILDLKEGGLHRRSGQISPRAALWALPWHTIQYNVDLDILPSIARKRHFRVFPQVCPKSEQGELPGPIVEDRTAVERARDRLFVGNDRIEVRFGFESGFDRANEAFEAAESVEFVLVA